MYILFFAAIIIIVFLLATAVAVAAEFSIVSVDKEHVKYLANNKKAPYHRSASRLMPHLRDNFTLDHCVAACQIVITAASLIIGAVGEKYVAQFCVQPLQDLCGISHDSAAHVTRVTLVILFTLLQVLLGELIPKSIAARYTDKLALLLVWPVDLTIKLADPLIHLLNGSGLVVLRLLGFDTKVQHSHSKTFKDLINMVNISAEGGFIDQEDSQRLTSALKFPNKRVGDIFVPYPSSPVSIGSTESGKNGASSEIVGNSDTVVNVNSAEIVKPAEASSDSSGDGGTQGLLTNRHEREDKSTAKKEAQQILSPGSVTDNSKERVSVKSKQAQSRLNVSPELTAGGSNEQLNTIRFAIRVRGSEAYDSKEQAKNIEAGKATESKEQNNKVNQSVGTGEELKPHELVYLRESDSVAHMQNVFDKSPYSRLPVYGLGQESSRIVGIVHIKDVCVALAEDLFNQALHRSGKKDLNELSLHEFDALCAERDKTTQEHIEQERALALEQAEQNAKKELSLHPEHRKAIERKRYRAAKLAENMANDKVNSEILFPHGFIKRDMIVFCTMDDELDDVREELNDKYASMAVVLDKDEKILGVVTLEDILEVLLGNNIIDEADVKYAAAVRKEGKRRAATGGKTTAKMSSHKATISGGGNKEPAERSTKRHRGGDQ